MALGFSGKPQGDRLSPAEQRERQRVRAAGRGGSARGRVGKGAHPPPAIRCALCQDPPPATPARPASVLLHVGTLPRLPSTNHPHQEGPLPRDLREHEDAGDKSVCPAPLAGAGTRGWDTGRRCPGCGARGPQAEVASTFIPPCHTHTLAALSRARCFRSKLRQLGYKKRHELGWFPCHPPRLSPGTASSAALLPWDFASWAAWPWPGSSLLCVRMSQAQAQPRDGGEGSQKSL